MLLLLSQIFGCRLAASDDLFQRTLSVDFHQQTSVTVIVNDWCGLGMKRFQASPNRFGVVIITLIERTTTVVAYPIGFRWFEVLVIGRLTITTDQAARYSAYDLLIRYPDIYHAIDLSPGGIHDLGQCVGL